jgi:hypothetical protein
MSVEVRPEDRSTRTTSRHPFFEPVALVLLSLATVGTAWCSFQAASWSGVSQRVMNLSAAASRRAATKELQSRQMTLVDVLLFSQYINARASSNETAARFYAERLRRLKTAFEWMSTRPFENPRSAKIVCHQLHHPRELKEAAWRKLSQRLGNRRQCRAGRPARHYRDAGLGCVCADGIEDGALIRKTVLALGLARSSAIARLVTLYPL